jgi:hypothetical protein
MISSAFHDAKNCANGEPTPTAMDATIWLMTDAPSQYKTPIGSFAWACGWLSFDVQQVREHGLPHVACNYLAGDDRTRGLPEVFAVWAEQRSSFLANGRHDVKQETSDRLARIRVKAARTRAIKHHADVAHRTATREWPALGRGYSGYSQLCGLVGITPASEVFWREVAR